MESVPDFSPMRPEQYRPILFHSAARPDPPSVPSFSLLPSPEDLPMAPPLSPRVIMLFGPCMQTCRERDRDD